MRVPAWSGWGGVTLFQVMAKGAWDLPGTSFIRTLIQSWGLHLDDLITSQRPHLLIPIPTPLRLGLQHMAAAGIRHSVHSTPPQRLHFTGLGSGPGIGIFKSSPDDSNVYPKVETHWFTDWLNVSVCNCWQDLHAEQLTCLGSLVAWVDFEVADNARVVA